jgi:hypothetical protein
MRHALKGERVARTQCINRSKGQLCQDLHRSDDDIDIHDLSW